MTDNHHQQSEGFKHVFQLLHTILSQVTALPSIISTTYNNGILRPLESYLSVKFGPSVTPTVLSPTT